MEVPRSYSTSNSARNSDDRRLLRCQASRGGGRVLKKYQGIGPKLAHRCALTGTEHLTPFSAFPFFPSLFTLASLPGQRARDTHPRARRQPPALDARGGAGRDAQERDPAGKG